MKPASVLRHLKRALRVAPVSSPRPVEVGPEPIPSRQSVLRGLTTTGSAVGMEIGAFYRPLVSKAVGDITYVDYVDTESLRSSYRDVPSVDPDEIVEVDIVWRREKLVDLVGEKRFDYILASHVIEHVPDLVFWLEELRSVLKPEGVLRLIVPDRRYTFDHLRKETTISDVVDAYIRQADAPLPRAVFDAYFYSIPIDAGQVWRGEIANPCIIPRVYPAHDCITTARDALAGAYRDIHCWVFTPSSFVDLFVVASEIGLIRYRCEMMVDTPFNEHDFVVGLVPSDDRAQISASWHKAAETLVHRPDI